MRLLLVALALTGLTGRALAQAQPRANDWQVDVFADFGYLYDANAPSNHLFRSRGTTARVDAIVVNMAGASLRKLPSESSRWGVELSGHTGEDSKIFAFSATAPNVHGANWLRHLGTTNASWLFPVGRGMTVQGGIFTSLIGYDGLYAKDNYAYTRPWTADFTPFLMLGVNAAYPVTERMTVTGLVVNGYWHLARANNVPSVGGQVAYRPSDRITVKQTVLWGPHQANTSFELWRFISNTIIERKTSRATAAIDFHVASERVDTAANQRAWWIAGQVPVHVQLGGPWSVTVRPEFAWDSRGRWTTTAQTVAAFTSTVEYRMSARRSHAIVRLEHRFDRSTGSGGGFYKGDQSSGTTLVPNQHLIAVGLILTKS